MKEFLCPVDLSSFSFRALEQAAALALTRQGRLRVLYAVNAFPGGETAESARADLKRFLAGVKLPAGVQVALADGDPRTQILRAAAEAPTDCIVMGTHGRRGFERFVLGSVTEHVLRKAACPVLAVPPLPDERRPAGIFPSVLCAIDFAAASLHALDLARSLVAPRGRLVLIHSIQWPFGLGPSPMPREMEALRASLEGDAEERLERVTVDQRDSVTIERHVAAGKPHAEILRCARDAGAALIVAGLHSHAVNDIALLGSTTRRVLHDAPCPVLTTR